MRPLNQVVYNALEKYITESLKDSSLLFSVTKNQLSKNRCKIIKDVVMILSRSAADEIIIDELNKKMATFEKSSFGKNLLHKSITNAITHYIQNEPVKYSRKSSTLE